MKAAIFDQFGQPETVLQVRDVPVPEPGPGQVRVRMIASPINPSDLLHVSGQYGKRPSLPSSAGFEGVGVVEKSGGGILGWRVTGRRVAVLNPAGGNWQEQVVIPARHAVPIPRDIPDEQAAAFFVNPATAIVMTAKVLRIPYREWLLQTAAGSALGRMIIRLAKHQGFRTINVVRRQETADELRRLGADNVINTAAESLEKRVRDLTGGKGVRFAIDAVGGQTGSAVVPLLAAGGRMLVYGTLSEEPLEVPPRVLMVGGKRIEGFWLAEWVRAQNPLTMLSLFRKIGRLIRAGVLISEIAESYPLDQIATAVKRAAEPGRTGKVLVRMG